MQSSQKQDIRSWAALPSHKERLSGQIYEPGKEWDARLAALIRSVRKGTIVEVLELRWLVDPRKRADKKRRKLVEVVKAICEKGGIIREVLTKLETPKDKAEMLMVAYERIAYPTPLNTPRSPGKPEKLTADEKAIVKTIWESRKHDTGEDALAAVNKALEPYRKKVSLRYMYDHFGKRD